MPGQISKPANLPQEIEGEQWEFRWNGQSVVEGQHPNGNQYQRVNNVQIAQSPPWVLELMRTNQPVTVPRSSPTATSDRPIPLVKCLAIAHRKALEGNYAGGRNNTAFKLARDLIGVAHYLNAIGQPFEGDPETLYFWTSAGSQAWTRTPPKANPRPSGPLPKKATPSPA